MHVSTDEVYGDLPPEDPPFTEQSRYDPSSPYSASKASSDHLARAWFRTYGLPIIITNCSNNYGPYQFPEKLVPKTISNALRGEPIPVYGNGMQIRDWLFVEDHAKALNLICMSGYPGSTYNIGGEGERTNIDMIHLICDSLKTYSKAMSSIDFRGLITFVEDRPGHDYRYAVDASKLRQDLGLGCAHTDRGGHTKNGRLVRD